MCKKSFEELNEDYRQNNYIPCYCDPKFPCDKCYRKGTDDCVGATYFYPCD